MPLSTPEAACPAGSSTLSYDAHPYPAAPLMPLDYWLNSDSARLAPVMTPSALRNMAWSYGQYRGLIAASVGLGAVLLAAGALALAMVPGTLGLWIPFIVVGLAMVLSGVLVQRTKLPAIARTKQPATSRAAGTTSSGVALAVVSALAAAGPMAFALSSWLSEGPGPAFSFIAVMLLIILAAASVFIAPAYCIQHARRDFRRYIDTNPALRQELEALSLQWRDPVANQSFGPL